MGGDAVCFTPTRQVGELAEWVLPRGQSHWISCETCRYLNYNTSTQTLSDERGTGGMLPDHALDSLLRWLAVLCDQRGVAHNLRAVAADRSSRSLASLSAM